MIIKEDQTTEIDIIKIKEEITVEDLPVVIVIETGDTIEDTHPLKAHLLNQQWRKRKPLRSLLSRKTLCYQKQQEEFTCHHTR
jgi:hypothetical protein